MVLRFRPIVLKQRPIMIDQVIGKESRPLPLGVSALDRQQYAAVAAKRVVDDTDSTSHVESPPSITSNHIVHQIGAADDRTVARIVQDPVGYQRVVATEHGDAGSAVSQEIVAFQNAARTVGPQAGRVGGERILSRYSLAR